MFRDTKNAPNPFQDQFGHPRILNSSRILRMVPDSDVFLSYFSCGLKWDALEVGGGGVRWYVRVHVCTPMLRLRGVPSIM